MAHKDLSHLSETQIKDLIKRYYDFEKISDLLEEFEINVHSSRLVRLFPDVIHDKLFCKYCPDVNLVSKLESRSFSNMDNFIPFSPFCPLCNHSDNKYCSCHNCKEIIKQKKQAEEEDKINVLRQAFLRVNIEIPIVEKLTLKDALYLLSVVEHSATKDLEFIKPYLEGHSITKLAPDEELRCDIIEHLNCRGFIQINPLTSSLDAFIFDQGKRLTGYRRNKVLWDLLPNMNIEEKKEYLESIRAIVKDDWASFWKDDNIEMWELITKQPSAIS